jgi:hypothetical protein
MTKIGVVINLQFTGEILDGVTKCDFCGESDALVFRDERTGKKYCTKCLFTYIKSLGALATFKTQVR